MVAVRILASGVSGLRTHWFFSIAAGESGPFGAHPVAWGGNRIPWLGLETQGRPCGTSKIGLYRASQGVCGLWRGCGHRFGGSRSGSSVSDFPASTADNGNPPV